MQKGRLLAVRKPGESSESTNEGSGSKSEPIVDGVPFEHRIQLYLADAYGVEVPSTRFWITLTIIKQGTLVTIQLPAINFETGPFANNLYEVNNPISGIEGIPGVFLPPPQNGGYLYTSGGFLPKELQPNEILNLSFFGPSNNGNNIPFTYIASGGVPAVSGVTFVPPAPGYLLQITNAGALVVQGLGTLANIIPPGTQNLLPTTVTYIVKPKTKLTDNTQISFGEISTAGFSLETQTASAFNALRDIHYNDAFDNVVAFAWSDNSNVPDQVANANTMNLAVAIGKVKDGKLKMRKPVFIPTPFNFYVWDTSVAINRTNKKNIVVSWGLLNNNFPVNGQPSSVCYRAVSFDGGKTFPINGPTNIQPTGFAPGVPDIPFGFSDNPGVKADKFGNFLYLSTNSFDSTGSFNDQPFMMISSDGGVTYTLVTPNPFPIVEPDIFTYDFPTFCFGGDGQGNYGAWIRTDFFPLFDVGGSNGSFVVAFIPITGLGTFGTSQPATFLSQFQNNNFVASISASEDGRVWIYGEGAGLSPAAYTYPGSGINNNRIIFKSPGAIDANYAGPWDVAIINNLNESLFIPIYDSQPVFGFFAPQQGVVYDDRRQALYAVRQGLRPDFSQNTALYFMISRNNGQSWSNPLELSNTEFANRGFISVALDTVTGNLLFGWYDGRNHKNLTGLNYFGTVISSKCLDKLVEKIPYSNPEYTIPPSGFDPIVDGPDRLKLNKAALVNIGAPRKMPGRLGARLANAQKLLEKRAPATSGVKDTTKKLPLKKS